MAGKSGKSGRRAGPGKRGAGVEKKIVGKRVLVGSKFRVLDGGDTVLGGNEREGWQVYKGLAKVEGGWENGEVRLEDDLVMGGGDWGVSGQGEWKVWEDEEKEEEKKKEEERKRVERRVDENLKRMRREMGMEEEKEEGGVGMEEEEEEEGLGWLEEWKLKREREEKERARERKEREKEGALARGKEKGWNRKETLELWSKLGDYREVVEETKYVFGMDQVEARCFLLDRELRKVMEEVVLGEGGRGKVKGGRKVGKGGAELGNSGLDGKVEDRKKEVGVEGGRTYGEMMEGMGGGGGLGSAMEVERKLRKEREEEERKGLLLEKELGKTVEVVLDSQQELSGREWKREEVEKELGLGSGEVKGVVGRGNRLKVTLKDEKRVEELVEGGEERWEKVLGGKVGERRRMEQWVGIVLPGVEVEVWEKRMEILREVVEQENGIKLMKMPGWLIDEKRRRQMGLKYVGVVLYVARESVRVEMMKKGVLFLGDRKWVKRWVEERQLLFCTKCAVVGHSWWDCGKKRMVCSVCAVEGHTGWQHKRQKCNVGRVGCLHYRKCNMCGGNHTMKEANEGNCWGVRAEMVRLRSLVG